MLYPIGIQNFAKIRLGGFVYVDKTAQIYDLCHSGNYFFLSRPRRFGKSLLVSTMEAYFSGRRDLFDGLAIAELEKDWTEFPVLHVDFSGKAYDGKGVLGKVLDDTLSKWEAEYGCENRSDVPGLRFGNVIEAACRKTGRQVVVLIDEYDKPIVDNLDNEELREAFRCQLQGFYSVLKAEDGCIRFGFLTGVTKIGKMSVFSGLNNLKDISMDIRYADICGISEADLKKYFTESIQILADANRLSEEACYAKLADMYDGYHFCEDAIGMYNPFSLLNTLDSCKFREYWFNTGTPTFLVKALKTAGFDISTLLDNQMDASEDTLSQVDYTLSNPIPLLYQSGYLTIKDYDPTFRLYSLGFPNREVAHGFMSLQLGFYAPVRSGEANILISRLYRAIQNGQPEAFMKELQAMFAGTSYQVQGDAEKDFQYAMQLVFRLITAYPVSVEQTTCDGRIDLTLQTDRFIYLFEFKVDKSAEDALRQIDEKQYALPFSNDSRQLFRIGANFASDTRRLDGWIIQ